MSRLLIVDDEERIRDIIKKYAQFEGLSLIHISEPTRPY